MLPMGKNTSIQKTFNNITLQHYKKVKFQNMEMNKIIDTL